MSARSVSEAIEEVRQLGPLTIEVEGILNWEFEDVSLSHWPRSESHARIWITQAGTAFDFNDDVMKRWSGKKVIILGEVEVAKEESEIHDGPRFMGSGFGHMGMSQAQIKARRVDLVKSRKRSENHPDYL